MYYEDHNHKHKQNTNTHNILKVDTSQLKYASNATGNISAQTQTIQGKIFQSPNSSDYSSKLISSSNMNIKMKTTTSHTVVSADLQDLLSTSKVSQDC